MPIARFWWQVMAVIVAVLCVDNVQSKRHIEERRILGGVEDCGNFPWAVKTISIGPCTGSMISGRFMVTAAHCLLNEFMTGYVDVADGSTVLVGCSHAKQSSCRQVKVKKHHPHPCYVPSTNRDNDDIAILELEEDLNMAPEDYAVVDNLHGDAGDAAGDTVTLLGWGLTANENAGGSYMLRKVDVPLATRQQCRDANPYDEFIDFNNVLCTGGGAGKDSCQGDSGGAVVKSNGGRNWVIGVLSKGSQMPLGNSACGIEGRYGVYTEIARYTDWIAAIEAGQEYKCSECPCIAPAEFWKTKYPDGPTSKVRPVVSSDCDPDATPAPTPAPPPTPAIDVGTNPGGNTVNSAARPGASLWASLLSSFLSLVVATRLVAY